MHQLIWQIVPCIGHKAPELVKPHLVWVLAAVLCNCADRAFPGGWEAVSQITKRGQLDIEHLALQQWHTIDLEPVSNKQHDSLLHKPQQQVQGYNIQLE